ncbi:MAG: family 16 glycosylhydrolase [Bacteroidetes bacterium]|jgi:beta-glucanase (GH16 family)|nr:family 16 glycosylhydrolase [Bacteroidota bacterium]
MRKIVLLAFSLASYMLINAQTDISEDFESPTPNLAWFADDSFIDTHQANPLQNSNNNSNFVLIYQDIGGLFANIGFDYSPTFDLSGTHEFSLLIYVPSSSITGNSPNQISLKLQNGNLAAPWSTQTEIIKPIVLDQWQTITFDFNTDNFINLDPNSPPPSQRIDLNRLILQVNGEDNNDPVTAYIDDFSFTSDAGSGNGDEPIFDELVWQDEFNYSGPVDDSKWFHQTQLPQGNSWFNGEIQHYTDRIDNAEVSNGTLKIIAKAETFTDQGVTKNYTSARLNSKFAFTYGKVEIRAKLPTGVGTWPALWTLGQNIDEDGGYWDNQGFDTTSWPACGELDIMEHWGDNQDYISSAIHSPSSFGATVNTGGQNVSGASNQFHLYTMKWTEDFVRFSVDGVTHYTYNPAIKDDNTWPFDLPQYILFNVAILPNIESGFTESSLEVDFIRIYQEETLSLDEQEIVNSIKLYPNPVKHTLNIQTQTPVTQYYIYNTLGNLIAEEDLKNNTINVSQFSNGFYIIKLIDQNQNIHTHKFIKQ